MSLRLGHGCFGQRMLSEHERYYGLRMDALVSVCSRNTNVIMVWAWMLWSAYALGTRMLLWFERGCFGQRMLSEHNVIMVWAWMLWSAYALGTRTLLWFGHGCFGQRMLSEHECYYGLSVDALVSVCSRNTMLLWFGHGCFGQRMLSEHERYYGCYIRRVAAKAQTYTPQIQKSNRMT